MATLVENIAGPTRSCLPTTLSCAPFPLEPSKNNFPRNQPKMGTLDVQLRLAKGITIAPGHASDMSIGCFSRIVPPFPPNSTMRPYLEDFVLARIRCLEGDAFQDFVVYMMLLIHGSAGFQPMRTKKDRGCDGIVLSEGRVIACYGPEKYAKGPFVKKANDDWNLYSNHWASSYPLWRMIVNHDVAPAQEQLIRTLRKDNQIWGPRHLLHEIDNSIKWAPRLKLLRRLGIPDEQISQDVIYMMIEDLAASPAGTESVNYGLSPDLLSKIEINYQDQDIDLIRQEYETTAEPRLVIQSTLNDNNDWIQPFKGRVIRDFKQLSGVFSQRISSLFAHYKDKYAPGGDDFLDLHIQAVIHYVFEQCLIGKPPAQKG